jgi:hypothetical protein
LIIPKLSIPFDVSPAVYAPSAVERTLVDALAERDDLRVLLVPDPAAGEVTDRGPAGHTATRQGDAVVSADELVSGAPGAVVLDGAGDYLLTNVPATRRNADPNPVGAINTAGLIKGGAGEFDTFERGTLGQGDYPAPTAEMEALGITTAFRGVESSGGGVSRVMFERACTEGEVLTFSRWIYAVAAANGYRLAVRSVANALVTAGTTRTDYGSWIRRTMTWTAPATATYRFSTETVSGNSEIFWTGGMLEVAGAVGAYFPTPAQLESREAGWLGTAHASSSDLGLLGNGKGVTWGGVAQRENRAAAHTLLGGSVASGATQVKLASGSNNLLVVIGGTTYTFTDAWPNDRRAHLWALHFNEPADTAALYIDGIPAGTKTGVSAQHSRAQSLRIGAHGAGNDVFDGLLGMHFALYGEPTVDEHGAFGALRAAADMAGGDLLTPPQVDAVEQDSDAEIAQCVYAVLATEQGQRLDLPDYGLPDQTFGEGGADLDAIREAAEEWEPRAEVLTDSEFDGIVDQVVVEP